jgi:hypothetical protein
MKANKGSGGIAENILNLRTIGSKVDSLMPQPVYHQTKVAPSPPVPINQKTWWVPQRQSGCCREERNFLLLPGFEPPDCQAHSIVTILGMCYSTAKLI